MNIPVTIAILAGGQSTRMGADKSFVPFRGKPLISHVLEKVSQLSLPIMLIANNRKLYETFGLPIFGDLQVGKGSLGGLYTALHYSSTSHIICVACDMPCLNPALLRYLIDQRQDFDAVVPQIGEHPQALHAVYRKTCLPLVAKQVEQGHLKIREFFSLVNCRFVDEQELQTVDPLLASFININTPEALRQLEGSACGESLSKPGQAH